MGSSRWLALELRHQGAHALAPLFHAAPIGFAEHARVELAEGREELRMGGANPFELELVLFYPLFYFEIFRW